METGPLFSVLNTYSSSFISRRDGSYSARVVRPLHEMNEQRLQRKWGTYQFNNVAPQQCCDGSSALQRQRAKGSQRQPICTSQKLALVKIKSKEKTKNFSLVSKQKQTHCLYLKPLLLACLNLEPFRLFPLFATAYTRLPNPIVRIQAYEALV